ncbi:MAG: DUF5063 domain-containing protein [Bacteroidales bacterium]|nr:DUF5063 domain-containing protein [Bacteroidales bacterium]
MNIEFLTVAREYCLLIENCPKYTPADFRKVAARMLAYLYVRASVLPEDGEELLDGDLMEYVDEFEYQNMWSQLSEKIGDDDSYIKVVDIRRDEEVAQGSISEDMADIYQSLKNYVMRCQMNIDDISNDAQILVQREFTDFWGASLTNALMALHAANTQPSEEADDDIADPQFN